MNQILVLGTGMVARPLVRYLIELPQVNVTIVSPPGGGAHKLYDGFVNAAAAEFMVEDEARLSELIKQAKVVVSLLPYTYHVKVAELCIAHGRHLVTTSYVNPAMAALDKPAREAGVVLLNELGLDPGIDHMSAMQVIHKVQSEGGVITGFRSYCGGLPPPEANNNPFGYKFSWSPRGVVLAARNSARYLQDGELVEVAGSNLFRSGWPIQVPGFANSFESYPNRDALPYMATYGIESTKTMFRGTLRNQGWCAIWDVLGKMGYLNDEQPMSNESASATTMLQLTSRLMRGLAPDSELKNLESGNTQAAREAICTQLGVSPHTPAIMALDWLGFFGDEPLGNLEGCPPDPTPVDVLTAKLLEKLQYGPEERDMVVLYHDFQAEYPDGTKAHITASLRDFGVPNEDTAMSRLVGYPAAIGTRLLLEDKLQLAVGGGIRIPTHPAVYEPVMAELAAMGIRVQEEWQRGKVPNDLTS